MERVLANQTCTLSVFQSRRRSFEMWYLHEVLFRCMNVKAIGAVLVLFVGFVAWIAYISLTQRDLVRELKKMATKKDLENSISSLKKEIAPKSIDMVQPG
jgi:hypothetical protein